MSKSINGRRNHSLPCINVFFIDHASEKHWKTLQCRIVEFAMLSWNRKNKIIEGVKRISKRAKWQTWMTIINRIACFLLCWTECSPRYDAIPAVSRNWFHATRSRQVRGMVIIKIWSQTVSWLFPILKSYSDSHRWMHSLLKDFHQWFAMSSLNCEKPAKIIAWIYSHRGDV